MISQILKFRSVTSLFAILFYLLSSQLALGQSGRSVSIVRDAEIEGLLADYTSPILKAARLQSRGIEVILVNERSFNAFVSGRRIFVNIGAIMQSETPNEIIGVIAHEAGHLAGNHQERLRAQLDGSKTLAIVGALLGAGAVVAGSTSGSNGGAAAGSAIIAAAPQLATRNILKYKRSEEINADTAALKYLKSTKQSAQGMLKTFERFSQNLALAGVRVDPYRLSHPLPKERISLLQKSATQSPYFDKKDPKSRQLRHDMARAKIAAFSGGINSVRRAFSKSPNSLAAVYGQVIATDLAGRSSQALQLLNKVIKKQPSNPYLYELKGELELKTRKADQAVKSFTKAVKLDKKKSGLIKARLGFAYVATGKKSNAKKAIAAIKTGLQSNPNNFNAYRSLSSAYALTGDIGNAELSMAEGHFRAGNRRDAKIFAGRALQKLVKGKPSWQRAKDILTVGN
ncbi:M48 family metalloprotease [Lentilitoribacter sp. EG35]|uniref:M48 family metalloprotease n=1 Tax=Lentilitoribacter sp. EG35 TaxID=3234192 RepID=UPI003460BEB4